MHLGMHDLAGFELLATIKKLKLKIESTSPLVKLFFTLHKEGRIIAPSINSTLEGIYRKSSLLIVFVLQFRKALEIHIKQHYKKRDYLNCSINIPHL